MKSKVSRYRGDGPSLRYLETFDFKVSLQPSSLAGWQCGMENAELVTVREPSVCNTSTAGGLRREHPMQHTRAYNACSRLLCFSHFSGRGRISIPHRVVRYILPMFREYPLFNATEFQAAPFEILLNWATLTSRFRLSDHGFSDSSGDQQTLRRSERRVTKAPICWIRRRLDSAGTLCYISK